MRIYHGHAGHSVGQTRTYESWKSMRKRCSSSKTISKSLLRDRQRYAERGITVCERWQTRFVDFLEDMGEAPEGMTLDRIDNNKGYFKENCRWATRKTQSINREAVRPVTFMGRTMYRQQWADEMGVTVSAINHRVCAGQSPEEAVAALYAKRLADIEVKP